MLFLARLSSYIVTLRLISKTWKFSQFTLPFLIVPYSSLFQLSKMSDNNHAVQENNKVPVPNNVREEVIIDPPPAVPDIVHDVLQEPAVPIDRGFDPFVDNVDLYRANFDEFVARYVEAQSTIVVRYNTAKYELEERFLRDAHFQNGSAS